MKRVFFILFILFLSLVETYGTISQSVVSKKEGTMSKVISSDDKSKFDYFFYKAVQFRQERRYDEAFDLLVRCSFIDAKNDAMLFEFAQLYSAVDKPQKAHEYLIRAVEESPDNVFYREQLLVYQNLAKEYKKAIDNCIKLIELKPYEDKYVFYLVNYYELTGEYGKALQLLSTQEKRLGIQPDLSFRRIKIFYLNNTLSKAFKEMRKLIKAYPENTDYQTMLGDMYLDDNQEKKALDIYHNILSKTPNDGIALHSLINYYRKKSDTQNTDSLTLVLIKAKDVDLSFKIEILQELFPDFDWQLDRNPSCLSEERSKKLGEIFEYLLSQYSNEEAVQLYYISFLLGQKDISKAIEHTRLLLEINPYQEDIWRQLVDLLQPDADAIVGTSNKALEYFPKSFFFHYMKGIAFYETGKLDEALQSITTAIDLLPQTSAEAASQLWSVKGDLLYTMKNKQEAFNAYDKALEYNPHNLGVLNNYAYFLALEKKDLRKAERMSAKTIEAMPLNATFLDTYAWIFFKRGEFSLAKFYIEKALAQDTVYNSELYAHYGDILYHIGDIEKAVEAWKKAAEKGSKEDALLSEKIKQKKYIEPDETH